MSDADLHALFERYVAVLNAHDFERLREFMHDDLVVNGAVTTREQMISDLYGHVAAVPDLTWRLQDVAIDGDRIAARFFNTGVPISEWLGAEPNGAIVEYAEHVFHKIRDGRFYEQNFLLDEASIHRQLRAEPGALLRHRP